MQVLFNSLQNSYSKKKKKKKNCNSFMRRCNDCIICHFTDDQLYILGVIINAVISRNFLYN